MKLQCCGWVALILLCCLAVNGCQAAKQERQSRRSWDMADLRLLEAPNADEPNLDLIAAYEREAQDDVELRFDLLGSPDSAAYDLYLAIDTGPGIEGQFPLDTSPAIEWDLLLAFPARGLPHAFSASGGPASTRPRSIRSEIEDSFTARIDQDALGQQWKQAQFQAFITHPGSTTVEDSIGPLRFETPQQVKQAPLALIFWDALPSATPAQALRRWSGAHTGPFGQRHGLKILLDAARQTGVPVTILDLQDSERLAALETLGGLSLVREMQGNHLLAVPDMGMGDAVTGRQSLLANRKAAKEFRFKRSSLFYGTAPGGAEGHYQAVFARLADTSHIRQWKSTRMIPLPRPLTSEEEAVSAQGLSIETRKALLLAALSPAADDLVVLGGPLPSSPWGDLLISKPALADIRGHPWIQVLTEQGLAQFPTQGGAPDCADMLCLSTTASGGKPALYNQVSEALQQAPDNIFSQLAWQSFLKLSEPTSGAKLGELRAGFFGQLGPLLAAAEWNENQLDQSGCGSDLDWDGEVECILSSDKYLFIIDPQGGRLVFGAARAKSGPLQLVGPRSQFVVGLGDPADWKPELGAEGDPQEVPGGFADAGERWQNYAVETSPGKILLTHPQTGAQKTYQLDDAGLHITIESRHPFQTLLPLALIDRGSPLPGTYAQYHTSTDAHGAITVNIGKRASLQVTCAGAVCQPISSLASLDLLAQEENPDLGYPAGFFVPFPLTIVEIRAESLFTVHLASLW